MKRMLINALIGQTVGFFLLVVMFALATPHRDDWPVLCAFSFMGAVPFAAIGALFGAVSTIREEMRETRRELKHWQSMQMYEEPEKPSTGIKPAPPSGRT